MVWNKIKKQIQELFERVTRLEKGIVTEREQLLQFTGKLLNKEVAIEVKDKLFDGYITRHGVIETHLTVGNELFIGYKSFVATEDGDMLVFNIEDVVGLEIIK